MTHIVFIGNPGGGKSTLLNSLLCRPAFKSGVAVGGGLTSNLQTEKDNGVLYSDTPGLDDIEKREKAAEEISKVLKMGGTFKLVFVCTLESGRVRSADVTTIDLVLSALERVEVDCKGRFSVLLNKLEKEVMDLLDTRGQEKLRAQFSSRRVLKKIGFMPNIAGAVGKKDFVMTDCTFLKEFLHDAPVLEVPEGIPVEVSGKDFDGMKNAYEEELADMQRRLEEIAKERRDDVYYALLNSAIHGFCAGAGGAVFQEGFAATWLGKALGRLPQAFNGMKFA